MGAMAELLRTYEYKLDSVKLIPSDGGRFEVKVGDRLVYSKLKTGQHIDPTELVKIVGEAI
ncbi:MAG: Rdx family protein [Anaerolineales bacterium]